MILKSTSYFNRDWGFGREGGGSIPLPGSQGWIPKEVLPDEIVYIIPSSLSLPVRGAGEPGSGRGVEGDVNSLCISALITQSRWDGVVNEAVFRISRR